MRRPVAAAQGPSSAPAPADDLPPTPAQRPTFFLGTGTAATQIEGAVAEDGRSPSIWDTWARAHPDSDSPNVTDDFYHKCAPRTSNTHFANCTASALLLPSPAVYQQQYKSLCAAGTRRTSASCRHMA